MDTFTPGSLPGEARLRYLDNDFEVLKAGRFVTCAVTKRKIALVSVWLVSRLRRSLPSANSPPLI